MSVELSDSGEGIRFTGVMSVLIPGTDGAVSVYSDDEGCCCIYYQPRTGLFLWVLAEEFCYECCRADTLQAFGSGDKAAATQALTQGEADGYLYAFDVYEALDALEAFELPAAASTAPALEA